MRFCGTRSSAFATSGAKQLPYINKREYTYRYRFSAFWLRSSRNNCSLEFNSSNGGNAPKLLIQFLRSGTRNEACFARPTGCPGIAVLPGAAHPHFCGGKYTKTEKVKAKHQFTYISCDHLEQELLHVIFYFIDDNLSTVIMLTVGWFLILLSSYAHTHRMQWG